MAAAQATDEGTTLLRIGDLRVEVVEVKGLETRTSDGATTQPPSSTGSSIGGLAGGNLGIFCSVVFEGEEQRTPVVLEPKWDNCMLEYGIDGTEQEEGLVIVVKERKETGKKGVLREDELGRLHVPLHELELMQARDNWYPLVTKAKGTNAAIRLVIDYTFSQIDDLINIFSEPAYQSDKKQKLSLTSLQYNIMRVILALMPLFRIIKQLIELFKWERPARSMLALLIFLICCLFDYVASLAFGLASLHFLRQHLQHYRERRLDQDLETDDELSKDAWKDWKAEKQRKDKAKAKDKVAGSKVKKPKSSIFTKMRRVQVIAGKIADKIEPVRALWDWKDPKKSKVVMSVLIANTLLFLFVSFWFCFRYALLFTGLYLFTLNPLYKKFPRFKKRYHHSRLIKFLKNNVPLGLASLLIKLRIRNAPFSSKKKYLTLKELSQGCIHSGYLVKLASLGKIWKRRYFVLQDKQLLYFNSAAPNEKLVAWIDLTSCGIINLENNLVKNRPYSFDLFDSDLPRHYLLAANNEKEKADWVASLSMVLNQQPVIGRSSAGIELAGAGTSATATGEKWKKVPLPSDASASISRPRSRSEIGLDRDGASRPSETENSPAKAKVTLASLTEASKGGWLQKRGKNRKAWKTRYFVLNGPSLYYFKKANMDSAPVGCIDLEGAKIFSIQVRKKGRQFCMGLYARSRYYLLSTRDEMNRGAWLDAIKEVTGTSIASVDVDDDSDNESDEASTANWVPGRASMKLPTKSSSSLPLTPPDPKRNRRLSVHPRNPSSVSKRATVAFGEAPVFLSDEKLVLGDLPVNSKEGYLLRQEGKVRKAWRSRYVVLAADNLYIFASSQAEERLVDSIQLGNCSIYAVTGAIKGREHCIDIYRSQPSKHYLFAADDEKDRYEWISAIKRARGDKVVGETPAQEVLRKEKESASKLAATLKWMHQLIKENKEREFLKLFVEADQKKLSGGEKDVDDVSSFDLVRARESQSGQTLLHAAAMHGRIRLVKELVEVHRADINAGDNQSWTPLHAAANHSQLEEFEYLVDRGASLYSTAADGSSPLHFLIRFTQPSARTSTGKIETQESVETRLLDVVQKVIDMGADVNATNRAGDMPLHLAAQRPYFRLVKLLLENKANILAHNQRGESALDLATQQKHDEIIALLQAYELVASDDHLASELNSPPPSHPARSQERTISLVRDLVSDQVNADLATMGVVGRGIEGDNQAEVEILEEDNVLSSVKDDADAPKEITASEIFEDEERHKGPVRATSPTSTPAQANETLHQEEKASPQGTEEGKEDSTGLDKPPYDTNSEEARPAEGAITGSDTDAASAGEITGGQPKAFLIKTKPPLVKTSSIIGSRVQSLPNLSPTDSPTSEPSAARRTVLRPATLQKPLPPPPKAPGPGDAESSSQDGTTRPTLKPLPPPPTSVARSSVSATITLGELRAGSKTLHQQGSVKFLITAHKAWKRCQAVLADDSLYLFNGDNESEQMSKWIDMSKSNVVETVETKKEHWCFDVYSHETKEHSIFAADTEGEKKQWMEALRRMQGPTLPLPAFQPN